MAETDLGVSGSRRWRLSGIAAGFRRPFWCRVGCRRVLGQQDVQRARADVETRHNLDHDQHEDHQYGVQHSAGVVVTPAEILAERVNV